MSTSIKFTPKYINRIDTTSSGKNVLSENVTASIELAQKFTRHIQSIKEWKDRIASLQHLAENSKKLAGNPSFKTNNEDVQVSIDSLFSGKEEVDFDMFVECVDIVIDGYKQQALVGLTLEDE